MSSHLCASRFPKECKFGIFSISPFLLLRPPENIQNHINGYTSDCLIKSDTCKGSKTGLLHYVKRCDISQRIPRYSDKNNHIKFDYLEGNISQFVLGPPSSAIQIQVALTKRTSSSCLTLFREVSPLTLPLIYLRRHECAQLRNWRKQKAFSLDISLAACFLGRGLSFCFACSMQVHMQCSEMLTWERLSYECRIRTEQWISSDLYHPSVLASICLTNRIGCAVALELIVETHWFHFLWYHLNAFWT